MSMPKEPQIIIGKAFIEKVIPLVVAAKESIDIIIYEMRLRPGDDEHPVSVLALALKDAKERGVKVRALVSSPAVKAHLEGYTLEAKILYTPKLMHAKMMLIDNVVAIVGSHNYTQSAFASNIEISLSVRLSSAKNELVDYFKNLWGV